MIIIQKGKGRYGWTSFTLNDKEKDKLYHMFANNFDIESGNLNIHSDGQVYYHGSYTKKYAIRNDKINKFKKSMR